MGGKPGSWESPALLISGASSGIGQASALHMSKLGWAVFAGVRHQTDADRLKAAAVGFLEPLYLDVTDPAQIAAAAARLAEAVEGRGLRGLFNNAGIALGGPLAHLQPERLRAQLEVNVVGTAALTQACLPMLRQAQGRIVNMSSTSGMLAFPFLAPYAASKFGLEALSDAMRLEFGPAGVRVIVIQSGAVDTPIWEKSLAEARAELAGLSPQEQARYRPVMEAIAARIAKSEGQAPEAIARALQHALTAGRPRARYRVGREARRMHWLARLPTPIRDGLIRRALPDWGDDVRD